MPTTPRGIVTPNDGDEWDLVTDLAATAVTVDNAIGTVAGTVQYRAGLTSARPAVGAVTKGFMWFSTDTNILWRHNGAAWEIFGFGPFKSLQASSVTLGTVTSSGSLGALTGTSLSASLVTPVACRAKVSLSFQAWANAVGSGYTIGVAGSGATTITPAIGTPNTVAFSANAAIQPFTLSSQWFINVNAGTTLLNVVGQAQGAGGTRNIQFMNMLVEPVSE